MLATAFCFWHVALLLDLARLQLLAPLRLRQFGSALRML